MTLFKGDFVERQLVFLHALGHGLQVRGWVNTSFTLQVLHHFAGLSQDYALQAGEDLGNATPVNSVQVLVGQRNEHIVVDRLVVDQLNWQVIKERLLEGSHLINESRPQILEFLLLNVGQPALFVHGPGEALAAPQREELVELGSDLVFGVFVVVADGPQTLI